MRTLAIIGVLALLLVAACQPVVVQQQQQPEDKRQITVSSTAELTQKADQVEIDIGVETTAPDAATSQRNNAVIADKIVSSLKDAGLTDDEISTAGYNVYERQEWDGQLQRSVSKGYTTTNTVHIKTTKIDKAGAFIDAAAKAGANQVNSIQFTLTKTAQETLKRDAIKKATAEARGKADAIAEGLNVKLGQVASVNEANVYFPPNYARGYESAVMMADAKAPALPPISASDVSVTATVNVAYNIA